MAAAAAKSLQSCLTLSDPVDCSLPGSSVHGIFQARVLELGAIAFSAHGHHQMVITEIRLIIFFAAAAAKLLQSCPTLCSPIDSSPTRLPRPWDSQGKNTGLGCHFLLQCMKVKSESEVAQSCPTLSDPMDCSHQAPPSMGFSRQEYWSGVP